MKTKLLSLAFICFFVSSYAQIDLKLNPLGALFGSPDVSVDYILNDNYSVEGGLGLNLGKLTINEVSYKRSGFGVFAVAKHYFNPNLGGDKFGVGIYTRYRNISSNVDIDDSTTNDDYTRTKLALGLQIGWKKVSDSGFIFEFDFGAGRAFLNKIEFDSDSPGITEDDIPGFDIDVLMRVAIGYRLAGK